MEKSIAAAKPGIRSKCVESVLLFVEIDAIEPVIVARISILNCSNCFRLR